MSVRSMAVGGIPKVVERTVGLVNMAVLAVTSEISVISQSGLTIDDSVLYLDLFL